MARPMTSSGPAGAVVEATRITVGLARSRCCRLRATALSSSALAGGGEAEIWRRRDDDARSAVNLLEQLVINQDAAVFDCEQIRAPAGRQPDFQAAATHFRGRLAYGLIFSDLAVFELGNPDLA